MCSGLNRVSIFAWTESPPQRGPSPHFRVDQVRFSVRIGKSRNLSKIVSVLLSASVERVGVSRMRDFLIWIALFGRGICHSLSFQTPTVYKPKTVTSFSQNTWSYVTGKCVVNDQHLIIIPHNGGHKHLLSASNWLPLHTFYILTTYNVKNFIISFFLC